MNSEFDDPIEDLNYIIFRLRKYIRKTKYWRTLEELSEKEMQEIALYNRRIADFLDEIKIEFSSDYDRRDMFRGGYGMTPIFDFADSPEKLSSHNEDINRLLKVIDSLQTEAAKLVGDFTIGELEKNYKSRRGSTLDIGNHRAHKNRRQSNRVEFTLDDALFEAMNKEIMESQTTKAKWLREAVRLNLSVRNRQMLYDTAK